MLTTAQWCLSEQLLKLMGLRVIHAKSFKKKKDKLTTHSVLLRWTTTHQHGCQKRAFYSTLKYGILLSLLFENHSNFLMKRLLIPTEMLLRCHLCKNQWPQNPHIYIFNLYIFRSVERLRTSLVGQEKVFDTS